MAEPGIHDRKPPAPPTEPGKAVIPVPTPRAQAARVVVGLAVAIVLGAGPAIAWDVSTQAPQARSSLATELAPGRVSPWRTAGRHVKDAVGGIARVYLPLSDPPPASASVAIPAPAAPVPTVVPPRRPMPAASVDPVALAPFVIE